MGGTYGATLSSVSFYPQITQSLLLGRTAGITGCFVSEPHFGLQFEVNYSQRGWKEQNGSSFYQRQLNYVEMPIMTHFFTNGRIGWFLNLGPKFGYLLSEKPTTNLTSLTNPEYTAAISSHFDYGICAGSGFELHTKPFNVVLEGRYSYGLSDIFPNRSTDYFESSGNQVISITLGLMFRL
nr:porin family protein [Microbacter margulisiae]